MAPCSNPRTHSGSSTFYPTLLPSWQVNSWRTWHPQSIPALWHSPKWRNWAVSFHWPNGSDTQPMLQLKIRTYTWVFLQKNIPKHMLAQVQTLTLLNLDTNISQWCRLKCQQLLDTNHWSHPCLQHENPGTASLYVPIYVPSTVHIYRTQQDCLDEK